MDLYHCQMTFSGMGRVQRQYFEYQYSQLKVNNNIKEIELTKIEKNHCSALEYLQSAFLSCEFNENGFYEMTDNSDYCDRYSFSKKDIEELIGDLQNLLTQFPERTA